jgi:KH domain
MNNTMNNQLAQLKLAAKQQAGALHRELSYLCTREQTSSGVPRKEVYYSMQRHIVAGHSVQRGLASALSINSSDPNKCSELNQLQEVLSEAITVRSKLYTDLFQEQKPVDSFTESLTDLIHSGTFVDWISMVTVEEIIDRGDQKNRLFQLLNREGGGRLVDSETLARAARRSDIFTEKQCDLLRIRSTEAAVHEARLPKQTAPQQDDGHRRPLPVVPIPVVTPPDNKNDHCNNRDDRMGRTPPPNGCVCQTCHFHNPNVSTEVCGKCFAPLREQLKVVVGQRKAIVATITSLVADRRDGTGNSPSAVAGPVPPSGLAVWRKKPPTRGSHMNIVWIRRDHVALFLGHEGKNHRALTKKSGATSIYVFQEKRDEHGWCPVEIFGSSDAFEKAVALIEKLLGNQLLQPRQLTVKIIWIRNRDAPALIGPFGRNIKKLIEATGAILVWAYQEYEDEYGMCPVCIKGSPESVKKVASFIELRFDAEHECDFLPKEVTRNVSTSPKARCSDQSSSSAVVAGGQGDYNHSIAHATIQPKVAVPAIATSDAKRPANDAISFYVQDTGHENASKSCFVLQEVGKKDDPLPKTLCDPVPSRPLAASLREAPSSVDMLGGQGHSRKDAIRANLLPQFVVAATTSKTNAISEALPTGMPADYPSSCDVQGRDAASGQNPTSRTVSQVAVHEVDTRPREMASNSSFGPVAGWSGGALSNVWEAEGLGQKTNSTVKADSKPQAAVAGTKSNSNSKATFEELPKMQPGQLGLIHPSLYRSHHRCRINYSRCQVPPRNVTTLLLRAQWIRFKAFLTCTIPLICHAPQRNSALGCSPRV